MTKPEIPPNLFVRHRQCPPRACGPGPVTSSPLSLVWHLRWYPQWWHPRRQHFVLTPLEDPLEAFGEIAPRLIFYSPPLTLRIVWDPFCPSEAEQRDFDQGIGNALAQMLVGDPQ